MRNSSASSGSLQAKSGLNPDNIRVAIIGITKSLNIGIKKATGSLTLYPREIEAIQAGAPNKDILDVPMFDINIIAVPLNSDNTFACVLKNCEFTKNGREFDINSDSTEIEIPLILSHIKWK